jgi:hypothetical protein
MKRVAPLSKLEQSILSRLARYNGNGVVPKWLYPDDGPPTASRTVVFSRCLRRLERRGLVKLHVFRPVRKNESVGVVYPTREGLAVAGRMDPPRSAP